MSNVFQKQEAYCKQNFKADTLLLFPRFTVNAANLVIVAACLRVNRLSNEHLYD